MELEKRQNKYLGLFFLLLGMMAVALIFGGISGQAIDLPFSVLAALMLPVVYKLRKIMLARLEAGQERSESRQFINGSTLILSVVLLWIVLAEINDVLGLI